MPTCSAARAAAARPAPPAYWPRPSTASDPVEGEPCNTCDSCLAINRGSALDIIEIDEASNRGIDDMNDLKERVNYSPNILRYKVYIIDEVHMITREGANAFLKTLEEPPPHVIFILATTDPHKIISTITSRCQRFDFHRLSSSCRHIAPGAYLHKGRHRDRPRGAQAGGQGNYGQPAGCNQFA